MTPANHNHPFDAQDAQPVAHVDAQDESFIVPLREYLVTHGCDVIVNIPSSDRPTYHVVAGDRGFVKDIAGSLPETRIKRLFIIINGKHSDALTFKDEGKVLLMDPVTLTASQVKEVFAFFFVGREKVLDWRRSPEETEKLGGDEVAKMRSDEDTKVRSSEAPRHLDASQHENDASRIGAIIADVFQKNVKPKRVPHPLARTMRVWGTTVGISIAIIVVPFILYAANLLLGAGALYYGAKALQSGNASWATRMIAVSNQGIAHAATMIRIIGEPVSFVGFMPWVRSQERVVALLTALAQVSKKSLQVSHDGQKLAASLLAISGEEKQAASIVTLNQLRMMITSLHTSIALAEADLRSLVTSGGGLFAWRPIEERGARWVTRLAEVRASLDTLGRLLTVYPYVAGFDRERTYLVLLQNSMELRPTGGFIGSVGIATFAGGTLTDFTIRNVYDLDGQLRGHVDPPHPVANLLGQEHWYLRDSNMSPDFAESGAQAAWFYEKETGNTVDGVIGISLPFVVDLLRATGGIELSDYNDRITAENFYGKSLYYTKSQFFPGSTQKRDFLGTLARALVLKITQAQAGETFGFFRAVAAALGRHDIIFYFTDPAVEQLVSQYGWGQVVPGYEGCTAGVSCLFSPLYVTEANVSVNKASYFVKRTARRDITIEPDGTVAEKISLTFRNTTTGESGLGDTALTGSGERYRMYLTMVLPPQSSVTDVLVNGISAPRRTGTDLQEKISPPYVEKAPEVNGQFTIGVAADVEPMAESTVELTIVHSDKLIFLGGKAALEVFAQKQPGIHTTVGTLTVRYPAYWLATGEVVRRGDAAADRAGIVAKDGQFEYNTLTTHDVLVRLQFQQ